MRKFEDSRAVSIRCKRTFSVLKVIIIMFLTFSCSKAEKTAQEEIGELEEMAVTTAPGKSEKSLYESATKFKMHMQSLDECEDALIDSIDRQDWETIKKCAMNLKQASPVLFTGKGKDELPQEFVMIDTRFHYQALAVVEAAESREMVRLNIEYEKLRDTCDDCHEKFKKKNL